MKNKRQKNPASVPKTAVAPPSAPQAAVQSSAPKAPTPPSPPRPAAPAAPRAIVPPSAPKAATTPSAPKAIVPPNAPRAAVAPDAPKGAPAAPPRPAAAASAPRPAVGASAPRPGAPPRPSSTDERAAALAAAAALLEDEMEVAVDDLVSVRPIPAAMVADSVPVPGFPPIVPQTIVLAAPPVPAPPMPPAVAAPVAPPPVPPLPAPAVVAESMNFAAPAAAEAVTNIVAESLSFSAPPPPLGAAPVMPTPTRAEPPAIVAPPVAPAAAMTSDDDSRAHKRLTFEVNVDIVSEHNFYAGLTLNISEGGLFVSTHVQHPVGTRLEIRLLLPGDEEPTTIMTEVRWLRVYSDTADGGAGLGLRFVDVPPHVFAKISRFVQQRDPLYYEDD